MQPAGTVVTNGVLKTDAVGLISCAHGTCGSLECAGARRRLRKG